jgi:hypothetical protein
LPIEPSKASLAPVDLTLELVYGRGRWMQSGPGLGSTDPVRAVAGFVAVAETLLVSMGGCITSALTGHSAVEVVGAVLGTVRSRARRGLAAVVTR